MCGFILKIFLQAYIPRLTRTDIRISEVDVSFFPLSAEIKNLIIGNPHGYSPANALSVASLQMDVDGKSLFAGDTVIIDRVEINQPEFIYEIIDKKDNFRTIIDNIKAQADAKKDKSGAGFSPKKGGKKMLIRDFIIKNGRINLKIPMAADQTISALLPEIHLQNIGDNGAPPSEIFLRIGNAIYQMIRSHDVTQVLNLASTNLKAGLGSVSSMISGLGNQLKQAGERLKGLVEK